MEYKVKQVIVVRKDLNMRRGKQIAQACHASMKVFLDQAKITDHEVTFPISEEMRIWLTGPFAKICVYVESEQELLDIYNQAQEAKLPCALIVDAGNTEFHGVPTKTCISIGPAFNERIDKITCHLKLL